MDSNNISMIFEGTERAIEYLLAGDPNRALRYLMLIRSTVAWETLDNCDMAVGSDLYDRVIAVIAEQERVRMAKDKS